MTKDDTLIDRIDAEVQVTGTLTPEQRSKLLDVAHKCPVHRTLKSEINIRIADLSPSA